MESDNPANNQNINNMTSPDLSSDSGFRYVFLGNKKLFGKITIEKKTIARTKKKVIDILQSFPLLHLVTT